MAQTLPVLLREDVDHLGFKGDLVDVSKGYFRNYLGPKGKATRANSGMITEMRERMERRRMMEAQSESEAKEYKELIERTTITIEALAGPQGKLFGSITSQEIVKTLESVRKLKVDPKKVMLDEPLKSIGTFMVGIDLFKGVKANLSTTVVAREETAAEAEEAEEIADVPQPEGEGAAEAAAAEDTQETSDADDN